MPGEAGPAHQLRRLRKAQQQFPPARIYRGIGISTFVEQTAYGPPYYGPSGAPISTQDGCTLRLEPSGTIRCVTSLTDQGQGTLTSVAQIVADSIGISVDDVGVITGDSAISPMAAAPGPLAARQSVSEAALKAGLLLKRNILGLAGAITQTPVDALDIVRGNVVNSQIGRVVISLAEVGRIGYFRQDTLPPGFDVQLSVSHSHVAHDKLYYMANGVQASYVEVDCELASSRS